MDKYDTSQITEFPRFEEESPQSGVSTFFTKLWKFPMFSPSESSEEVQGKASEDERQPTSQRDDQSAQEYDEKPETGAYAVEFEGRSLPNVLKRISSLVALGSRGGTRYADTELARYWMPDDISRECYECAARFSALRRRHHCRVCGQIFCSRCCSQRVPGQIFGCAGGLRVCNYCCNIVLSYLKENDMSGDMSTDLRTLQENLQVKFPDNKPRDNRHRDNFMFAREQDERCDNRPSHKEALQDVFKQLSFALPTQQHRYRLVRYNGVWRGCDMLQWVMDHTYNKTRAQATLVCQSLLRAGYVECATEVPQFADYALYRPTVLPRTTIEEESPGDRKGLVESVSSYCLDLNLGESSARLIKAPKTEAKESPSSEEDNPIVEQSDGYTESRVDPAIASLGENHLQLLMRQCVARYSLPHSWAQVLYPLCQRAAQNHHTPDLHSNDIDIRNYVQVKKVPGGSMRESCLIHGVVMTKNVAHRGMPQQVTNPTVLLLDCSIAYQRVEGKLISLEPVLLQEQEYLVRCAARITALQPSVVLVRGSTARAVQDALRGAGVALACGVRERALRRTARCSKAEIVTSIDARIGMPRLGTCKNFYVKDYSGKTLMVLENCAEPNLGSCILLRGASLQELVRVKKVVKFMLLACYNWKLEKAFLGDIEAVLLEPGVNFEDDDEDEVFNDKNELNKSIEGIDDERKSVDSDSVKQDSISDKEIFESSRTRKQRESIENVDEQKLEDSEDSNVRRYSKENTQHTINDEELFESSKQQDSIENINKHNKQYTEQNSKSTAQENNGITVIENNHKNPKSSDTTKSRASEIEDPLQKVKPFVRKTDSDKNLSCGVPIKDFSDPLHTLSVDDEVFLPRAEEKLKADEDRGDRWCIDDAVLSMSPNVLIPPPLHPPKRAPPTPRAPPAPRPRESDRRELGNTSLKELHPFLKQPITTTMDDPALKASLAHYRATGCRLVNNNHTGGCPLYKPSVIKQLPREPETESKGKTSTGPLDPWAPESHQRLSLLLYSFSSKSANVPDFCVNPWIVTMEMYGRHDISLGAFLEKYCFNGDYKCSSSNCNVPVNQHVRRFVHGDVCITITCNTVGHSNVDKLKWEQNKQVMFWSRCSRCKAVSRAHRLSQTALSLSLGMYLCWRVRAGRLIASGCRHPASEREHAFSRNLTAIAARYSKISTYDIQLPPEVISTRYDTKQMRDALINQLNELMLKGHETFNGLSDTEADKEYQNFKQHMEQIHLALTSSHLQEQTTITAVVRSLWNVSDRIIAGEKMMRDAQDKWSSPSKPQKSQPDSNVEEKSEFEDSSGDASNIENSGTTYIFSDTTAKESEKEHAGAEEDEEKGDKKTVRQILSQLLSNNQPSNQSGMIISTGVVPVVVMAGEIGSVIAATLASVTYQRSLRAQRTSLQFEQEEADITGSVKDKTDASEKSKAAKSNDHIEVLLKDSLLCRVYFAQQFHKLRHMLLSPLDSNPHIADEFASRTTEPKERSCCDDKDKSDNKGLCDIEEGFLRSLAYCVPWAAKGGKSGSTFSKTKDDRYVLKEMTKPEWQRFLEFAPHYFNYVISCHQNKQPSLLARIVGVYSVGGAGNGILVMENVWYHCDTTHKRFDLKGSSRNRLTADTPFAVLMDENLLHLRWDTPLYIQSHIAHVLWACIERDTTFLASNAVMDYSLLLGVVSNNTLVLGIVDYIRTFTWEKKLEHLVKKNLGAGEPTVVSPEQYKARFSTACKKYFLQCPTHWDAVK